MEMKQKRLVKLQMITNGVVVEWTHEGEYNEHKRYFATRDEAIMWVSSELVKELSFSQNTEAKSEPQPTTDEMPF
jgi:hypothetical protein